MCSSDLDWNGRSFALVDTGGIEPGTNSEMLKFMRRQAEIAIETATVIIMGVDVTVGLTAEMGIRDRSSSIATHASVRSRKLMHIGSMISISRKRCVSGLSLIHI